jgi:hypothetical protein
MNHPQHTPILSLRLRGEMHPQSKLTDEQVREIRRRFAARSATNYVVSTQLATEYGISRTHVLRIVRRERWAHLPD